MEVEETGIDELKYSKIFFLLSFLVIFLLFFNTSFLFIVAVAVLSIFFALLGSSLAGFFDEIETKNHDESIAFCKLTINKTKSEFDSLGGELNSDFFQDPDIISNIRTKIDEGVKFRFLFGPDLDINSVWLMYWAREDKIEMRRLKQKYVNEHFKIADGTLMDLHASNEPLQHAEYNVLVNSKGASQKRKEIFDQLWKQAEKFDVDEALKGAKPIEEKYIKNDYMKSSTGIWGENSGFIKKSGEIAIPATQEDIEKLEKTLNEMKSQNANSPLS